MKLISYFQSNTRKLHLGLIAVLGFSFWFFLGFPFANHNESYIWVVQLDKLELLDVLSQRLQPDLGNFRPLGQATAWLEYRLFGGSIYPAQLLNYLLAAASWFILFLAIEEKRVFSLISLVAGGFFFSGYIYLFHLHGVFYSPLLLFVAVLFFLHKGFLTDSKFLLIFLFAIFVSLFHPFALLIYLGYIFGFVIKKGTNITKKQYIMRWLFMMLAFGLMKVLNPGRDLSLTNVNVLALFTSYKMLEVNNIFLSITAFLLGIMTAGSINIRFCSKVILIVIITLLSFLSFLAGLPITIVWISVCLLKAVLMRKWPIAFLIIATFFLPLFGHTGSPTHSIFVLMVCAAVVPLGWFALENRLYFMNNRFALSLSIFVLAIVCCLRYGVDLPMISELTNPILAEKEKTFQLENIINWLMKPGYSEYRLILNQNASAPTESDNAIDRTHRPPTQQCYLNPYIDSLRPLQHEENNSKNKLIVCFGNEEIKNAEVAYVVEGRYAGDAIVYLPSE